MAHTVISVNLPPHIDPTKSLLAYGDRALPKLVRNQCLFEALPVPRHFFNSEQIEIVLLFDVYYLNFFDVTGYSVRSRTSYQCGLYVDIS